ncbi:cytochrome P450, partial [Streptomyces sp. A7024]|nr:cytochrome P450 [Streptomyces coryli]
MDFAQPLPVAVLAGLLGVGGELVSWLGRRLDAMSPANDHLAEGVELAAADRAAREVGEFAAALLADPPRGAPLAPMLAELAGAPYPGEVRAANLIMLLAAGTETARSMLAHALHVLIHDPVMAEVLRVEPGLVPGFVAEMLRTQPPAHVTSRWTSCPVELAGAGVPAGRLVLVLLAAANRDPGRFPDPGGFSVRRGDDGLAFGMGRHYCLGAG